jgi:hypothetical protein
MDKIDFYIGIIQLCYMIQWLGHYQKNDVTTSDIIFGMIIGTAIAIRLYYY